VVSPPPEIIDPEHADLKRNTVEKPESVTPPPPRDFNHALQADHSAVVESETPARAVGIQQLSQESQMAATAASQPIKNSRPLPSPPSAIVSKTPQATEPGPSSAPAPAPIIPIPPETIAPALFTPPANRESTLELTHLTSEEAQFLHTLLSQNVPHGEIVDMMRVMRAQRRAAGTRTDRGRGPEGSVRDATADAGADAPPAYDV
jgi:hypothetical protein